MKLFRSVMWSAVISSIIVILSLLNCHQQQQQFVEAVACISNQTSCSALPLWLEDCSWSDACGAVRTMRDVYLRNVDISSGTATIWNVSGGNVSWHLENVRFNDCFTAGSGFSLNVVDTSVEAVTVYMDGISTGCLTNNLFQVNILSEVGKPVDLKFIMRNSYFDTFARVNVVIRMTTYNGSSINIENTWINGGLLINATDIDISMNNVTIVDTDTSMKSLVLASGYRPAMGVEPGKPSATLTMNASIIGSTFNITNAIFDTEQGEFYFENTKFKQDFSAPTPFVWQSTELPPMTMGGGGGTGTPLPTTTSAQGTTTTTDVPTTTNVQPPLGPPLASMQSTFRAKNCDFINVALDIVTKDRFRFVHFNTRWNGKPIRTRPIVRNESIDVYDLDIEIRQSVFEGTITDAFYLGLFDSGISGSGLGQLCQGIYQSPNLDPAATGAAQPPQKNINVHVFIEDTTFRNPQMTLDLVNQGWGMVHWGFSGTSTYDDCMIPGSVNVQLFRSEVPSAGFGSFLCSKAKLTLEIMSPRNNVSTTTVISRHVAPSKASEFNFVYRNIDNKWSAPGIHCTASTSFPCSHFGDGVAKVLWRFENAIGDFSLENNLFPYETISMIPCGRDSCSIDVSGTAPLTAEQQIEDGPREPISPFNASTVFFLVPFTGNSTFTDVDIRFQNGARMSGVGLNVFNPWGANSFIPHNFANYDREVLGFFQFSTAFQSFLEDNVINIAVPVYNGITFNISESRYWTNRIVLNASMCSPNELIPDFPKPVRTVNFFTHKAHIRAGNPDGYPGLISDFTTCEGQNIFMNPQDSLLESKFMRLSDTFFYTISNLSYSLIAGKQIVIHPQRCNINGTIQRFVDFSGPSVLGLTNTFGDFELEFENCDINIDLPPQPAESTWNQQWVMVSNVPGANPVIRFRGSTFRWMSGGPPPEVNEGVSNSNYTESRTIVTGYTPAWVKIENTNFTVFGAMMESFMFYQGVRSNLMYKARHRIANSSVSVSSNATDRPSSIRFFVLTEDPFYSPFPQTFVNGITFAFVNSSITFRASIILTFSTDGVSLASTSEQLPLDFTAEHTRFEYTAERRFYNNASTATGMSVALSVVEWSDLGQFNSPRVSFNDCELDIKVDSSENAIFAVRFQAKNLTRPTLEMTASRVKMDVGNTSYFGFVDITEWSATEPEFVSVAINNSVFDVVIHDVPVWTASSAGCLSIGLRINGKQPNITIGPNVEYYSRLIPYESGPTNLVSSGLLELRGYVNGGHVKVIGLTANVTTFVGTMIAVVRDSPTPGLKIEIANVKFNVTGLPVSPGVASSDDLQISFLVTLHAYSMVSMTNCNLNMAGHTSFVGYMMITGKNSSFVTYGVTANFFLLGDEPSAFGAFLVLAAPSFAGAPMNIDIDTNSAINIQAKTTATLAAVMVYQGDCGSDNNITSRLRLNGPTVTLGFDDYVSHWKMGGVAPLVTACPNGPCNMKCLNMSIDNSALITIDDRRNNASFSAPPANFFFGGSNTTVNSVSSQGAYYVIPQYFTWITSYNIAAASLVQNTVQFRGRIAPAPTLMAKCFDNDPMFCPTLLEIRGNNFYNSTPTNSVVPITSVLNSTTNNTDGTAIVVCNKANGQPWEPNPLSIRYSVVNTNSSGCFTTTTSPTTTAASTTTSTTFIASSTTTPSNSSSSASLFSTTVSSTTTATTAFADTTTPTPPPPTTTATSTPSTSTPTPTPTPTTPAPTFAPPTPAPNMTLTAKPAEVIAAQQLEDATTSAVTGAGAGAGLLGMASPSLATVAARAGMISKLASCEPSLDEELPRYVSPTGLALDVGSYEVRYHVGAVVANLGIMLGFGVLSLLFAALHTCITAKPNERRVFGLTYRSLGAARFPGCLVFFLLFFSQPFIGSSLTAIFYGNTASACICVFIIVFCLAGGIVLGMSLRNDNDFLATYRTREDIELDKKLLERENLRKGLAPEKEEEVGACEKCDKWYELTVEGVSGWWYDVPRPDEKLDFATREKLDIKRIENHEGHKYFMKRMGAAFDYYQSKYRTFIVLEFISSVVLGICDGLVEVLGCKNVAYILVALFGLYVVTVFLVRPYATRKDFFFCGLISLLQLIGGVFTVLPKDTLGEDQQERIVIIVCSTALFIGIVQAAEGLISDGLRFVAEKCTSEAERKEHAEQTVDYNQVGDAASPILRDHTGSYDVPLLQTGPGGVDEHGMGQRRASEAPEGGILLMPSAHHSTNNNNNNNNADYADMPLSARQKAQNYVLQQQQQQLLEEREMQPVDLAQSQRSTGNTPEESRLEHQQRQQQQQQPTASQQQRADNYAKAELDEL